MPSIAWHMGCWFGTPCKWFKKPRAVKAKQTCFAAKINLLLLAECSFPAGLFSQQCQKIKTVSLRKRIKPRIPSNIAGKSTTVISEQWLSIDHWAKQLAAGSCPAGTWVTGTPGGVDMVVIATVETMATTFFLIYSLTMLVITRSVGYTLNNRWSNHVG